MFRHFQSILMYSESQNAGNSPKDTLSRRLRRISRSCFHGISGAKLHFKSFFMAGNTVPRAVATDIYARSAATSMASRNLEQNPVVRNKRIPPGNRRVSPSEFRFLFEIGSFRPPLCLKPVIDSFFEIHFCRLKSL